MRSSHPRATRARPSRQLGRALALALLVLTGCGGDRARPHVIVISADTLRADRLNTYGYAARRTTPHIDALAADGIVFESAITAAPWTLPAHMSLFTALSPSAHGMVTPLHDLLTQQRQNRVQRLPADRTTLAEALAAHGYRTAAFTGGATMDPRLGFDQGFAVYDTAMFKMSERNMGEMLDWIRDHREAPFFLFWHTFETHFPYLGDDFLESVLPETAVTEARATLGQIGDELAAEGFSDASIARVVPRLHAAGLLTRDTCEALYAGAVRSLDRWVGELVRALRDEGLYDETLIVLTSDHGEEFAEHNAGIFYNGHGHSLFEEVVHVPLLVKLPAQAHAGSRVADVARLIDVFPTVLDVAGLPPTTRPIEGASLRPLWENGSGAEPRTALIEATAFGYELKAARTAAWKYVVAIDEKTVAARGRQHVPSKPAGRSLFDLTADPGETRNLLEARGTSARAERLDRTLRTLVAPTLAPTDSAVLDPETVERLRALGYVP